MRPRNVVVASCVVLCVAVAVSCGGGGGGGEGGPAEEDPGYPASVAHVELPVTEGGRALVGIEGTDGTMFWVLGVRDENGVPLHADELLVAAGSTEKARFRLDDRQRVTGVDLPDGTSVEVVYGLLDAEVTITAPLGETDIIVVDDPYAEPPGTAVVDPERLCEGIFGIPGEQQYSGVVQVCVADVPPRVFVTATDPKTGQRSTSASKVVPANAEHDEYFYFHYTALTDDYGLWQRLCICSKVVTAVLIGGSVASPVFGIVTTLSTYFRKLLQAADAGLERDATKAAIQGLMEVAQAGSFTVLDEAAQWLLNGGVPCTRTRYDSLQRAYQDPVKITVLDHRRRKEGAFVPGGDFADMPTIDFTDDCCLGVEKLRATLKPGIPYEGQSVVVVATIEPVVPGCVLRFEVYDPLLSIHYIPVDSAGKAYHKVPANPDYPTDQRSAVIFTNAGHRVAIPWTPKKWP